MKTFPIIVLIAMLFSCKSYEYDCTNQQIQPAFIGFSQSDVDTLIYRRFKANDNFQTLLDTFRVDFYAPLVRYHINNDTTIVSVGDLKNGVMAGNDWQIFIPAKNKTIFISEISSESKKGKCNGGIFSMDKFGCSCINKVFSVKKDNQVIFPPNASETLSIVYIR